MYEWMHTEREPESRPLGRNATRWKLDVAMTKKKKSQISRKLPKTFPKMDDISQSKVSSMPVWSQKKKNKSEPALSMIRGKDLTWLGACGQRRGEDVCVCALLAFFPSAVNKHLRVM